MAESKPRLQVKYENDVRKALVELHGYANPHQIPCVEKITLNMGVGQAIGDKKVLDLAVECMTEISGQKPVITTARKSIANFRRISRKAFDGRGNYTLGLTEQLVFPELNPDKFTRPQGMNITIVTSANTNDEARDLLEKLGMPFKQDNSKKGAA